MFILFEFPENIGSGNDKVDLISLKPN